MTLSTILGKLTNTENNELNNDIYNGISAYKDAYTLIGYKRLNNIHFCIENILKHDIEGDFIETGVYRGGATIFMAYLNKHYNLNKKVFVADSFKGLPCPDDRDKFDNGLQNHCLGDFSVSLDSVKKNFEDFNLLDDNIIFIEGFFDTSLKNADIGKLSILRLDCDLYSSTMEVLDILYDKVSLGGYIIVDDMCLPGCNKAIVDFRNKKNIQSEIHIIDWTGIYWIKE